MALATTQEPTLCTPQKLFSRNARQLEAWQATLRKRFVLYGGAAGGGKSFFLRWWCAFYLIDLHEQGIDGAQVMLACEDYPSLQDRQINKIRYEFPPELGQLKEGVTRNFVLNDELGGGVILLRNLDDPAKYLSAEFAGIAVDELTRNEVGTFNFLRSRMRWPGVKRPRFVGSTNPGGKGHGWVRSYWIDNEFPAELEPLRDEFVFVPAKASDNPYLSENYYRDLETLPAQMAKAYAEGSWDIFAGQYFTNFRADKHVIRAESLGMQDWWTKWISIDWGFEHKAVAHWHTKQPAIDTPTHQQPERTVTYREMTFWHVGPRELAQHVLDNSPEMGKSGPQNVYLGPDAWAKRTDEQSIAEQIGDVFSRAGWRRPEQADNDRVGGWMLMYQLLDRGEWVMADNCTMLIKSLPTLVRDESHVEDIEKVDGDDAADCARYGLKSRHRIGEKPLEMRVQDRIQGFQKAREDMGFERTADPTAIAMMSQRALMDERKKSRPVPVFRPRYAKFGTWRTR